LYKYQINPTTEIFNCSLKTIKDVFNKAKKFVEYPLAEEIMSNTETNSSEIDDNIVFNKLINYRNYSNKKSTNK